MRNTLTNVIAFAAGAAVGSAVTWKLVKTKYERIAQEEIDSVKEVFSNRQSDELEWDHSDSEVIGKVESVVERGDGVEVAVSQLDIKGYAEQLQDMEYTDYSNNSVPKKQKTAKRTTNPYVIAPEEFGEMDGYREISLTYYADKVLADDYDEIVDDVDGTVGLDSLNHFGEYEDDSVFVRNDELKCDYEILLDTRKFTDVASNSPHQVEDEWDEMK